MKSLLVMTDFQGVHFFGGCHKKSSDTFAGAKVMIQNLITQLFKQIIFDTGFIEEVTAECHNGKFEELCWLGCVLYFQVAESLTVGLICVINEIST